MASKKPGANGPTAGEELTLLFERVERLEEEKKALGDDIKDVFAEAKMRGFDTKTMKNVLKLRKMDPETRRNTRAMIELYLQATGMSDGSLSDEALAFLEERRKGSAPDAEPEVDQAQSASPATRVSGPGAPDAAGAEPERPAITEDDARRLGTEAAAAGRPVTSNPFPARDPRRAAWDQAWCQSAGSDGMEIPDFLRAPPKPDAKGDEGKGAGA